MANSQGLAYQFGSPASVTMYGINNTTAVFTALASIESYDLTHEADTEEVRNSGGEVVGHIGYNERVTLNLNLIPSEPMQPPPWPSARWLRSMALWRLLAPQSFQ